MEPDSLEQQTKPLTRWHVAGVLLVALLIRGGALIVWYDNLEADPDAYREFAETLVETGVYGQSDRVSWKKDLEVVPSAYRPPLYPLILTRCVTSRIDTQLAIALTHMALGLATVAMTLVLGRQLRLGRSSAMAALFVAVDPTLLHHSTLVMTETLATFLATIVLYSLNRLNTRSCMWNLGLAGGTLALAALCRPVFFVTMAFAGGIIFLRRPGTGAACCNANIDLRKRWLPRALSIGSFAIVACMVLSPWMIRNWMVFERPVIATTHGGYTLKLGNNDSFYSYLRNAPWGSTWDGDDFLLSRPVYVSEGETLSMLDQSWALDESSAAFEIEQQRRDYDKAFSAIRNEPTMFAYACLIRNGRLWLLVPHRLDESETTARRWMRYAVGLWYAVVFVLAAFGCWSLWRERQAQRKMRRNNKEDQEGESETAETTALPRPNAPWIWGFLMIASFMLVHTFYWTNMRMRAPLMPFVALLAALGLACLYGRLSRRNATSGV